LIVKQYKKPSRLAIRRFEKPTQLFSSFTHETPAEKPLKSRLRFLAFRLIRGAP